MPGPDPAVAAVRLAVRRALAEPVVPGDPPVVLVGCSGGADSTALLAATVFETRRLPHRVVGVTVDHGLQEGSAEHAAEVVARMAAIGVDETASIRVHVEGASNLEAGAREARYAALRQLADHFRAGLVLLGHTLDDQAETVLLGLARGSGGRSIAGMRPAYDEEGVRFVRPLLGVRRAETEQACLAEGHPVWADPHNADPRFLRSRVRHEVLPVLERELGPGIAQALARTADGLQDDLAALDGLADEVWLSYDSSIGLGVEELAALPAAIRHRVIRRAALEAGSPASDLARDHVLAVDALVTDYRGQAWIDLPGPLRATRTHARLRFAPAPR